MGEENKSPPWVVIITSVLSLIGVLATAYFGYSQVRESNVKNDTPVDAASNDTGRIISPNIVTPTVDYSLSKFSGAHLRIGNRGSEGIVIVTDLTLQWDYTKCPRFREPMVGAPLIEYRYTAEITKNRGSKLLDSRQFKYGSGDVDDFYVDIHYPGLGVYQVWLEFKYTRLGEKELKLYQSQKGTIELCEKW